MKRFLTESGSIYEVDEENRRVRRLTGEHEPTPRQGPDGQWKDFLSYDDIHIGLMFVWEFDGPIAKTTVTSRVIGEEEV